MPKRVANGHKTFNFHLALISLDFYPDFQKQK